MASHTWPSWISPSPSRAYTRQGLFCFLAASAMPQAAEIPWPSDPVDISTPGMDFMSGWPWR